MKIGVKVGDVMTRNFVSAKPDIFLLDAVKLMTKKRVGTLILQEGGILKGLLTERDVLWALSKKKDLSNVKAGDVCTRKITTIKPSADLNKAIKVMKKAKFRKLPVTIKKKVIGFLTVKDIIRIQPELIEIAKEGYMIRDHDQKLERLHRIETGEIFREGICERCERFDILYPRDGRFLCEYCRDSI